MFTNPREIILRAGITDGMHVGDFGAGSGVYTVELAGIVRDYGRVYAIDIQKGLLTRLRNTLNKMKAEHVLVLHGDLEEGGGSKLADDALDFAVASNIFFQVSRKQALLSEIKRTLRHGGCFLLVDWSDSHGHIGPHPEHVLDSSDARLLCEQTGFLYKKHVPAGKYHYAMVFEKI